MAWLFFLVAAAYLPIFWGEIVFFRDPAHWNYPARAFVRQALLRGEFPHWNPFVGLGVSVWANPLYAIFYPPNWLLLLVPERLVASALTWQSAAHTLFGGVGLYLVARQFRCRPIASLVAGIAWAFSGYTTSMWSAGLLLIAGAWLPWVAAGMLAAAKDTREGKSFAKAVPKVAAPIAMSLLTGEVFISMISVGFGIATLAAWSLLPENRLKTTRLALALFVGAVMAALVGAIVIVPAQTLVAGTSRAKGLTLQKAEQYSFHPIRLLELVAPNAMGVPPKHYPASKFAGEKAIDGLPLAFNSYLGAAVVALALFAFGRRRPTSWMLLALWVFFLFVCFGRYTPVHALWRTVVIPFQYMRYPEKYVVVLIGWTALLAALGTERLLNESKPAFQRIWVLLGILGVAYVFIGFAFDPALAHHARYGALRGFGATALVAFALWLHKRQNVWFANAVVAIVALDLLSNIWSVQRFANPEIAQRVPAAATAIRENNLEPHLAPRLYRSAKLDESLLQRAGQNTSVDDEFLKVLTLVPNLGSVHGVATVPGYDATKSEALDELWAEGLAFPSTMLRLLAVQFVLLPVKDPSAPDTRTNVYEPLMDPVPGARLYRVRNMLPRVYIAGASEELSDKDTLFKMFTPEVASGGLALVAQGQGYQAQTGVPKQGGECQVDAFELNRLVATCEAAQRGLAVFVEQFAPGWSATIDGTSAKLLRVNHVMRGLAVEAGRHRIEMKYQPPEASIALVVSLVATIAILVLFAVGQWQSFETKKGPRRVPRS